MKRCTLILAIILLPLCLMAQSDGMKNRLVILADMGNEPDEEQQMIHMLVCSNEFHLEGLIAVTGAALRPGHKKG